MMFTTETKTVTKFERPRLQNFKMVYISQSSFHWSFKILGSLKRLAS